MIAHSIYIPSVTYYPQVHYHHCGCLGCGHCTPWWHYQPQPVFVPQPVLVPALPNPVEPKLDRLLKLAEAAEADRKQRAKVNKKRSPRW